MTRQNRQIRGDDLGTEEKERAPAKMVGVLVVYPAI